MRLFGKSEKQSCGQRPSRLPVPGQLVKAWFELTADEKKAVAVILFLALLGLGVRYWHGRIAVEGPASVGNHLVPEVNGGTES